jgi:hypothetical protein
LVTNSSQEMAVGNSERSSQESTPAAFFRCQVFRPVTLRLCHGPGVIVSVRLDLNQIFTRVKCREKHSANPVRHVAVLNCRRSPSLTPTNFRRPVFRQRKISVSNMHPRGETQFAMYAPKVTLPGLTPKSHFQPLTDMSQCAG